MTGTIIKKLNFNLYEVYGTTIDKGDLLYVGFISRSEDTNKWFFKPTTIIPFGIDSLNTIKNKVEVLNNDTA